jgi:PKD repeat protein
MDPVRIIIRLLMLTLGGFLVFQAVSASCPCLLPNFTGGNSSYSPSLCLCPFNQSDESYPFYPCNCPFYDPNQTISPCPTPCPCPFNTSCSLPPRPVFLTTVQADFTQNVTSGAAPLTVQFTDKSSGKANSWIWDFGDGSTSGLQNPVHVYTSAGTYTVTLTAGMEYDQGSVHSGISTVVHKDNLITVTGSIQRVPSVSGTTPEGQATLTGGLSAADVKVFIAQHSLQPAASGQVSVSPESGQSDSPGKSGILTLDPKNPDSISGTGRELLQSRIHPDQSSSTASLLLKKRLF